MENPGRIFQERAQLSEDERRILLLGLKVLAGDVAVARAVGFPVELRAIKNLVFKLGGRPDLL